MKIDIDEKDLQKLKGIDETGFSWRERLAIFFLLKVALWLSSGTQLFDCDINSAKDDILKGLKIHTK